MSSGRCGSPSVSSHFRNHVEVAAKLSASGRCCCVSAYQQYPVLPSIGALTAM